MARQPQLDVKLSPEVIVRMAAPEFEQLKALLFSRYPAKEWATFATFGWRRTPHAIVLTLAGIESQQLGDLDASVSNVAFQEPYTLRTALKAETHRLAVGVLHSHPAECQPLPSLVDDDMDSYFAGYFGDFARDRPYVSLIASTVEDELVLSGRVRWRGAWLLVQRFAVERTPVRTLLGSAKRNAFEARERVARLRSAFGDAAERRLHNATVAVIGAGGTGSAAIEVLARAGVGHLIIVDPDVLDSSNLERVHGSEPQYASDNRPKVLVAKDHVLRIDPTCKVTAIKGALPQEEVVDLVTLADVAVGCTDQQHSRLALSDLAVRYLVPAIDCGVTIEGSGGNITAQVVQLVRFLASDPCALCRRMTEARRLAQELMSQQERQERQAEAAAAAKRGESGNAYWHAVPQLNTVGYLTTVAGALAAGYVIGWLTGRFEPPFSRLQVNLVGKFVDIVEDDYDARAACSCRRARGLADQGAADALVTAPSHWQRASVL